MSKHDVTHEQIAQQRRTDFAGEWTIRFPMHVLRPHFDALRCTERFHYFRNRSEWRNDHHFDVGDVANIQDQ